MEIGLLTLEFCLLGLFSFAGHRVSVVGFEPFVMCPLGAYMDFDGWKVLLLLIGLFFGLNTGLGLSKFDLVAWLSKWAPVLQFYAFVALTAASIALSIKTGGVISQQRNMIREQRDEISELLTEIKSENLPPKLNVEVDQIEDLDNERFDKRADIRLINDGGRIKELIIDSQGRFNFVDEHPDTPNKLHRSIVDMDDEIKTEIEFDSDLDTFKADIDCDAYSLSRSLQFDIDPSDVE